LLTDQIVPLEGLIASVGNTRSSLSIEQDVRNSFDALTLQLVVCLVAVLDVAPLALNSFELAFHGTLDQHSSVSFGQI
jgi:hypothetical protein